MRIEDLATKVHRTREGTQHYKAFYWRGKWFRLTGLFGIYKGQVVAQAKSKNGAVEWSNSEGDFIETDTKQIKRLWHEIVKDVTDILWE